MRFTTSCDSQTSVSAEIVEEYGEERIPLGVAVLRERPTYMGRLDKIEVTIDVDGYGIISAQIKDLRTGKSNSKRF